MWTWYIVQAQKLSSSNQLIRYNGTMPNGQPGSVKLVLIIFFDR